MLFAFNIKMLKFVNKLFGSASSRHIKSYSKLVENINNFEHSLKSLSDAELKNKTNDFKEKIQNGSSLDEILPEAFAVVRESSVRTINLRHFDVQLIGGIVLHKGMIAEMKTGEGKTLVATLPAYLNSLIGKPVHIITVNDYLAERDSKWMGEIYKFLGLRVGCITSSTPQEDRINEYEADIVYATNHEIGFDYLRDNLKNDYKDVFFKKRGLAIVDEVDSILIDEARTPLIISGATEDKTTKYLAVDKMIKQLNTTNWIKLYIKWELLLIKELGFEINFLTDNNVAKNNMNNRTIPNLLLKHSKGEYTNIEIKEALQFNKSLLIENFIQPNRLRLPISRTILEKYFN